MILLADILNAARRGEMGPLESAARYCYRIACAGGQDRAAYAEAAEILQKEVDERIKAERKRYAPS